MEELNHLDYQRAFDTAGVTVPPSEIHGQLAGFLCVRPDLAQIRREYAGWLGVDPGETLGMKLDELAARTLSELDEYADFGFRILMPPDEEDIDQRFRAVAAFCSGFLHGAGVVLPGGVSLPEEASEVLADFERIAAMAEDIPDSEENEADLVEIVEYVRVSVLLFYSHFGGEPNRMGGTSE